MLEELLKLNAVPVIHGDILVDLDLNGDSILDDDRYALRFDDVVESDGIDSFSMALLGGSRGENAQ